MAYMRGGGSKGGCIKAHLQFEQEQNSRLRWHICPFIYKGFRKYFLLWAFLRGSSLFICQITHLRIINALNSRTSPFPQGLRISDFRCGFRRSLRSSLWISGRFLWRGNCCFFGLGFIIPIDCLGQIPLTCPLLQPLRLTARLPNLTNPSSMHWYDIGKVAC